jgi:hypothetical protein
VASGALVVEEAPGTLDITGPESDAPRVRFSCEDRRLRTELILLGVRAGDLTAHPGAVVAVLDDWARRVGDDPNGWLGALEHHLRAALARWGLPVTTGCAPDRAEVVCRLLGAAAWPMLAYCYDHEVRPLREIPRWALGVLRADGPRGAAKAAFGPKGNRLVAQLLPLSLIPAKSAGPDATLALAPLAMALVGADVLEPDALASLLALTEPWQPPHRWPTAGHMAAARQAVAVLGGATTRALLVETLREGDPRQFFSVAQLVCGAANWLRPPFPHHVTELRARCEAALTPAGTVAVTSSAADRREFTDRVIETRTVALRAPRTTAEPVVQGAWHSDVLDAIDGRDIGGARLCVPHSAEELGSWGRQLANCLGSYTEAVARGASWIIGIRAAEGCLIGCIEITPTNRRIRQVQGPRNNRLDRHLGIAAVSELVASGIAMPQRDDVVPA